MCGLCGFTGHIAEKEKVLRNMTDVITHRGPDSAGYFSDDRISMGFRRLSIIDLEGGSQPIYNEDKSLVLMFNGEIYNYKTLREELIAKACAKKGTWMEISTWHDHMTVEEIRIAMKEDVKFIISSDAHTPDRVGSFIGGLERAFEAGLPLDRIVNVVERK